MNQTNPQNDSKDIFFSVSILLPSLLMSFIFVYGFIAKTFQMSILDWNSFLKFMSGKKSMLLGKII
jgi:glucose/mannose transport system permease protein